MGVFLGSEGARFEILRSQSLVRHDRRLAARSCLDLSGLGAHCFALAVFLKFGARFRLLLLFPRRSRI